MATARTKPAKSRLRKRLRRILKGLASSQKKRKSQKIFLKVTALREFRTARSVLLYASKSEEVDTYRLIERALSLKKKVYLPRIDLRRKKLSLYRIRDLKRDLVRGPYGILQPRLLPNRRGEEKELDLVIAPGLGFSRRGARLGRGGGYFDRFLRKAKRAKKIGVAFREQIVKKIPVQAHDICMDRVITD